MPANWLINPRLQLTELVASITAIGPRLAVFLVYDRPNRASERPGLERAYFAQRCVSDEQLRQMIEALRSIGAYVRLFEGERPFVGALADGSIASLRRPMKLVYNGIEGSVGKGAFQPGRKALIPSVADSYGIPCANSNAYACALGRHKFHYLTVLAGLGLPVPRTWHYRLDRGWAGKRMPPPGLKVIVKSTYESWSVGVTEDSVFVVDGSCTAKAARVAEDIGQAVTVQEFIAGREVCVPVWAIPERIVTPPVEAILKKAPGDPAAIMTIDDNLAHGGVSYSVLDTASGRQLNERSLEAFDALELSSFARVDFRITDGGDPYIFDVGVSPGLSTASSAYASAAALGLSHGEFLLAVFAASLSDQGMIN